MKTNPQVLTRAPVLLLVEPETLPSEEWLELERRLPLAERCSGGYAARRLQEESYDLVVAENLLAGGGPPEIIAPILERAGRTAVVIHFRLPEGIRWLKLFEAGQFDLAALPMTTEAFFDWLEHRRARHDPEAA
jgi:hypothetical protein